MFHVISGAVDMMRGGDGDCLPGATVYAGRIVTCFGGTIDVMAVGGVEGLELAVM